MTKKTSSPLKNALSEAKNAASGTRAPAKATRRAAESKPFFLQVQIDRDIVRQLDFFCIGADLKRSETVRALIAELLDNPSLQTAVGERIDKTR